MSRKGTHRHLWFDRAQRYWGEMLLRLETDGAAIVRGFLSRRAYSRIAEIVGNAFAFLDAGGGDAALRENWISVGTLWLTNLEHCVAPKPARELVTLLSRANRRLGSSYLAADICSIRRLTDWHRGLHWHTDYHGGGTAHYDPCFNIWLPLTAVGREQPSIELVRGSHRRMRELPPSETGIFTDEWVAETFPAHGSHRARTGAPRCADIRSFHAASDSAFAARNGLAHEHRMPRHTPSCLSRIGTGSKSSNEDDAPAWQIGVLFVVGTPGHAVEIMASDAKETLRCRVFECCQKCCQIGFFWFRLVEPDCN